MHAVSLQIKRHPWKSITIFVFTHQMIKGMQRHRTTNDIYGHLSASKTACDSSSLIILLNSSGTLDFRSR
jgi:hypothetical protein